MKAPRDPKVRAERRRCLRIVQAWRDAFSPLRNEAEVVATGARARVDMADKIASAIRSGARS